MEVLLPAGRVHHHQKTNYILMKKSKKIVKSHNLIPF